MSLNHPNILHDALAYAEKHQPTASLEKKNAFANSVVRLIGEARSPLGTGPSVREHAAVRTYGVRKFSFEEACELLILSDGPIFGPIQEVHRGIISEHEYCFDNDPEDLEE